MLPHLKKSQFIKSIITLKTAMIIIENFTFLYIVTSFGHTGF